MEATPLQALHPPSALQSLNRFKSKRWTNKCAALEIRSSVSASFNQEIFPRRFLVRLGFLPLLSYANRLHAAPVPDTAPNIIRTRKLPSGVSVQEITQGEGQEAHEGDFIEFNYVCRRANGYFMYSTVDQFSGEARPVILPLDEKKMIKGLKDILVGMKVGGKRRASIPPSLGYINESLEPVPDEFGPRRRILSHSNEPLVFEVQLLKIL